MTVWYMNGAGNDFAVVDARNINIDMSDMARGLCERRGCDGFMALDNSSIADFKLHFYNSDGSRADMCGNGARCICRFAYDNGIASEQMTVETDAGIVEGRRIGERIYRVRLNTPRDITLNKRDGVDYCIVGVPHAVIEVEKLDFADADRLFAKARDLRAELNANVNFYSRLSEDTVKIMTYERGVADFTLACGTGSGAVARILFERGSVGGNSVTLQNQGGDLTVTMTPDGALCLEGGAEIDEIEEII